MTEGSGGALFTPGAVHTTPQRARTAAPRSWIQRAAPGCARRCTAPQGCAREEEHAGEHRRGARRGAQRRNTPGNTAGARRGTPRRNTARPRFTADRSSPRVRSSPRTKGSPAENATSQTPQRNGAHGPACYSGYIRDPRGRFLVARGMLNPSVPSVLFRLGHRPVAHRSTCHQPKVTAGRGGALFTAGGVPPPLEAPQASRRHSGEIAAQRSPNKT